MVMKITDFINGPVSYDAYGGQYFWINGFNGSIQMLAELRGYGRIQSSFAKKSDGTIDLELADKLQDEIGEFIAKAINEKIERDFNGW